MGSMSIGLGSMAAAWALGAAPASAYTLVSQQDHFLIELPAAPQLEWRSGQPSSVDGVTGLEFDANCPNDFAMRGRLFAFENRVYVVAYIGPRGTETAAAIASYLNSLHLLRH